MPHIDYTGPDGRRYPSATELTSLLPKGWMYAYNPKLPPHKWGWIIREVSKSGWQGFLGCFEKAQEGRKLGTKVHAHLEALVRQVTDEEESYKNSKELANALFKTVHPTIEEYVAVEPHLKCDILKIHGSADMIVRRTYDTGLWIGDWKTSYEENEIEHPVQLAVYAWCWNQEHPEQLIDKGFIARVDKKSKNLNVKIDEYIGLKKFFPVVKSLQVIYRHLHED